MPTRRRGDTKGGSWLVDISPAPGVRIRRTFPGALSRQEIRQEEAKLLAGWKRDRAAPVTLHAALERYWAEEGHRHRSAKDIDWQLGAIEDLTEPGLALGSVDGSTAIAIRERYRPGRSPATVNRVLSRLRRVLSYARQHWRQDVQAIAWRDILLREPEPQSRWLDRATRRRILRAAPTQLRHALILSMLTGLRARNVLDLRPRHIDRTRRVIVILGKGGKINTAPLSRLAWRFLRRIWPEGDATFIQWHGERIGSLKTAIRLTRQRSGVTFRLHDARHWAGQDLYDATGDLELVRRALHHSNISTTSRYARAGEDRIRDGWERVGKRR